MTLAEGHCRDDNGRCIRAMYLIMMLSYCICMHNPSVSLLLVNVVAMQLWVSVATVLCRTLCSGCPEWLTHARCPLRRCLPDLADECAVSNGGCWQGQYTVKGSKQTFSACKDQLQAVKVRAAFSSGAFLASASFASWLRTCGQGS
jgi:hypothetical protein